MKNQTETGNKTVSQDKVKFEYITDSYGTEPDTYESFEEFYEMCEVCGFVIPALTTLYRGDDIWVVDENTGETIGRVVE